jgi:hypothetical protein
MIDIQFVSLMGPFNRRIPVSLTVSDLYKIAFRGLKGRHTLFWLHFNETAITSSKKKISTLKMVDGSIISIAIDSSTISDSQKKSGATSGAAFEELSLIKVYRDTDEVLFSYWVPKNNSNSMASILFRYWRHDSQKVLLFGPEDVDVWSDLKYNGDGYFTGIAHSPWMGVSALLTPEHATGILGKEKVYINEGKGTSDDSWKDTSDDSDDSTEYDALAKQNHTEQPLVLKVYLEKHRSPESRQRSRQQKHLSRV